MSTKPIIEKYPPLFPEAPWLRAAAGVASPVRRSQGVKLLGIDRSGNAEAAEAIEAGAGTETFQDLATWELEHVAPSIITYTPLGSHYISPASFAKPVWVHASDNIARVMDAHLQRKWDAYRAGKGERPIVDLNHESIEMAEPIEIFYDEARGIMLRVRWLAPAALAVIRGVINSFSPAYFFVNGEFSGFNKEVGSALSNNTLPAIRTMPPIRPIRKIDEHRSRRDLFIKKLSDLVGKRIGDPDATAGAFNETKERFGDLFASYEYLQSLGA